ncbi:MAG: CHAD domain-containing protein [Halopseudomonas sp.]
MTSEGVFVVPAKPSQAVPLEIEPESLLGLATACQDEIGRLLSSDGWLETEPVHDVRVLSKRLRAWWRLWRQTDFKPLAVQANQQLRQLSGLLSETRDAQVLPLLCYSLASRWQGGELAAAIPSLLRLGCWLERLPLTIEQPDKLRLLDLLAQQAALMLPLQWPSDFGLEQALGGSDERQQRAAKIALAQQQAAVFHYWRKRVKVRYYQGQMLASIGLSVPCTEQLQFKKLAAKLGDIHDLDNLLQWLPALKPPNMNQAEQTVLQDALLRYRQLQVGNLVGNYVSGVDY